MDRVAKRPRRNGLTAGLTVEAALARRAQVGGTAPERVREAIADLARRPADGAEER